MSRLISATKLSRGVHATLAIVLLAGLSATQALAGEKQTGARQVATSTGGIVAEGSLGGTEFGPGRPPHYDVVFAAPSGVVAGTGPLDAQDPADLRRTWIAFDEVDGATGRDLCHAFANPSGLAQTYDGAWRFTATFDVSCPDDPRYRRYRVQLATSPAESAHWTWQNTYDTHSGFGGDGTLGSSRVLDTSGQFGRMAYGSVRICGWDGRSYRCFEEAGHTLSVYFTDGIAAVERPY